MRRLSIITTLFIVFTVTMNAQETQIRKRWFVDVGPSVYALDVESLETYPFVGITVSVGFFPLPGHRLSFGVAPCLHRGKLWEYEDNSVLLQYGERIKRNTSAIPFMFTYNYVFRPSKVFHLRLGPAVGVTTLSTSYTGDIDMEEMEELLDKVEVSTMFSLSANINAVFNINEKRFIDFGYRYISNSKIKYKDNSDFSSIAHQFNVTFGFRF